MANRLVRALDWYARGETISTLVHSEFVRNWLGPAVSTALTGGTGLWGGLPLMWVCVGSSIVFMTTTLGMAGLLVVKERNSPQNKLMTKPIVNRDLTPREAPLLGNRRQRLAHKSRHGPQMLSSSQVAVGVNRTLDKVQVGVEVMNNAFFPISIILAAADTEIEGEKPPRSAFPKAAVIIQPGNTIRLADDPIEMDEFPCQRLSGKLNMLIKYGHPKNEDFELKIEGTVDVVLESNGIVTAVILNFG
jgi:hypothetical protein